MRDKVWTCLILQPIAESAIALLKKAGLEVIIAPSTDFAVTKELLRSADAVITRNHGLSAREISATPQLRVLGVHGTGTDKVDKTALATAGAALLNTPGANAQSVSELSIALMLACSRSLTAADQATRNGDHSFRQKRASFEISGRRLGLIGFGHIAQLTAKKAQALGMSVGVHSKHTSVAALADMGIEAFDSVDRLCEWADIVSLHGVPTGTPVIGAAQLSLIGATGFLINTARGALIDETALENALNAGTIAGAGLDVLTEEPVSPDHPLLKCSNLIVTPHIGGSTREAMERTGLQVAERVIEHLSALDQSRFRN